MRWYMNAYYRFFTKTILVYIIIGNICVSIYFFWCIKQYEYVYSQSNAQITSLEKENEKLKEEIERQKKEITFHEENVKLMETEKMGEYLEIASP